MPCDHVDRRVVELGDTALTNKIKSLGANGLPSASKPPSHLAFGGIWHSRANKWRGIEAPPRDRFRYVPRQLVAELVQGVGSSTHRE